MTKINYITLFSIVLLASCTKHFDSIYTIKEKPLATDNSNPYKVSQQMAIAELENFLSSPWKTKSEQERYNKKIARVRGVATSLATKKVLTKALIKTKSSNLSAIIPDTLVYIADFKDDGFAVLSADSRVSSIILAIAEEGSIPLEYFNLTEEHFDIPEGVLDLDEFTIDDDENAEDIRDLKYTWWFRMITYDKPTNHPIIEFFLNV